MDHDEDSSKPLVWKPVPYQPTKALTFRACVAGGLIGCFLAGMNISFGFKTGWTQGSSVIAAILAVGVFGAIKPRLSSAFSPEEANITQTVAGAAGSMPSAAGFVSAIPALQRLGYEKSYAELTAWAIAVAFLGVFFAVPLRRRFVIVEQLAFPSGTATAVTIKSLFADSATAIRRARTTLWSSIIAALFTLIVYFVPDVERPPLLNSVGLPSVSQFGWGLYLDPLLFGGGMLSGFRIGGSVMIGAVLSWGVIAPYVKACNIAPGEVMSATGSRNWILWPGVAIMTADALITLLLNVKWFKLMSSLKHFVLDIIAGRFCCCCHDEGEGEGDDYRQSRFRRSSSFNELPDHPEQIPTWWWAGGLVVCSAGTVIILQFCFDVIWFESVVALPMSAILSYIAVRCTGELDLNPVGGLGKITQLIYAAIAPGNMVANLMSAAVVAAGASQAGDMIQDMKTGHLLNVSPREQFLAQVIGIPIGVLCCVPLLKLFDAAYSLDSEDMPVPAAQAWFAVAEVLRSGISNMDRSFPYIQWALVCGSIFGCILPLASKLLKNYRGGGYDLLVPSGTAIGIAFIIYPDQSITLFLGGLLGFVWRKRNLITFNDNFQAVACGLIAGSGFCGVVNAAFRVFQVPVLVPTHVPQS